jgi:hypothetical protein
MGGSATVFVNGHRKLPSGRLVAPYWGYASCMRHYDTGSMDPTACKVMQLWLQCRVPRTHNAYTHTNGR